MIRAAVNRPAVMWALAVAMLLAGSIAFTRLPLATRTAVELPRLNVNATWSGASPEVMEAYVTAPLEGAVQGVRGVKRVNSTSRDGTSSLTVELEPQADVQMARLGILERLELLRKELPPGVTQPSVSNFVPEGLEEAPLLSLIITGPYTPGALQRTLNERVKPRLSNVPGVAGVTSRGGTTFGVAVSYDAARLRQLGIAPERLNEAIASARVVASLGTLTRGTQVKAVVLRDEPAALDSLARLPVVAPGGRRFMLGELAVVRAEEDARGQFFRINGRPAVALDVTRQPGADAIATAATLRREIAALGPQLPPGMRLNVASDESIALAEELQDLARRGGLAMFAVTVLLLLMLRPRRAVWAVMGTTTVAVAATALTLYLFGIPANLLTLAGLGMGVGILVQNAIVVVERLALAPDTPPSRAEVARRMAPAVLGSTLTTAVVLLPFLYLQGNTRAAFTPFALAFVIALGWSVFTALVMVPAVSRAGTREARTTEARTAGARGAETLQAGHALRRASGLTGWVRRGYVRVLVFTLRWRWGTRLLSVGLVGAMAWVFIAKVPRSSWDNWGDRRTTVNVSLSFPRGSDPVTLDAGMRDFERLAVGTPGVEQVRAQGGGTGASLVVRFTREGGRTAAPLTLYEQLTQRGVLLGGASVGVYGEGLSFSNGGGGGGFATFRIQVKGFSYAGVEALALDVKQRLERITRVRDVRITSGGWFGNQRSSLITLEPDRVKLSRVGLTTANFTAALAREIRGQVGAQRLEIGGEELPVTVKDAGASNRDLAALEQAIMVSPAGTPVRLADVATISEREALGSVEREDQQYIRQVSYDFRGPNKLAQRTHKSFMRSLSAPAGYTFVDLTEQFFGPDDESAKGLWLVFALGIVLVVLTVALVFDSVWGAVMVLLSLPIALTGVVAAFWATDTAFTREAAVGVILVVGLAVNQAILLVDAALEARRRTGTVRSAAVMRAALDRAGMIVVVTLAALASLAPLSLGTDADSLFGGIALATAGGTVAGTLGVLLLMPAVLSSGRRVMAPPATPS
ncbi:MAG: efflux RND transporter permease subunit [Gemmatimonas sp.]|uniref:efflux RND transporter permease subunit n=1 Tax=Gemmatimonas sp. TaxID=1962908 RepID=UPI0025B80876|nr:efflux RND transporter permease subunit [Gemmatimonas sp.]MCA2988363.1 efflux RND transporter permease subunit [Gemmatimonas sp.]